MPKDKEEKVKKEKYMIGEIPTATDQVIIDTETDEQYTMLTFLAKLGNEMEAIKKALD